MSVKLPKPKPEPRRDRWGRYLIPTGPKGGDESYTRATTVAKGMGDTFGLEQWQQGQIANGMGRKPVLQEMAVAHPMYDENKSVYKEIIEGAFEASDGADGRRRGQALHKMVERLELGEITTDDPNLTPDTRARLIAYQAEMERKGIELDKERIEQILVLRWDDPEDPERNWRITGTTDGIATLADGRRCISDLKTGKNTDHPLEWAVQLAIYENHTDTYDVATDKVGPPLDLDKGMGIIIHLPSQGDVYCQVHEIDLNIGYGALQTAMERRYWQKQEKHVLKLYKPINGGSGGSSAQRDWLADRVQRIVVASDEVPQQAMKNGDMMGPAELLVALWQMTDIPIPLPQTLDPAEMDNMDAICFAVEDRFQLALPPAKPGTVKQTTNKEQ